MWWGSWQFLFLPNNPAVSPVKLLSAISVGFYSLHAPWSESQANIIIVLRMDPPWFTDFKETEIEGKKSEKVIPFVFTNISSHLPAILIMIFSPHLFYLQIPIHLSHLFSFSLSLLLSTWQHICDHRAPITRSLSFFTALHVTSAVHNFFPCSAVCSGTVFPQADLKSTSLQFRIQHVVLK